MKYIVNIIFNEEEIFDATVVDDYVKVDIPSNPFDKIEDILDMNIIRKKCLERLMLCRQFEDDTGKKLDNRGLEVLLKESSIIDNVNGYILTDSVYTRDFILNNIRDRYIYISNRFGANRKDFDFVMERYGDIDNIRFYIEGNTLSIDIDEYRQTIEYIQGIIELVSSHRLSPLEKMLYAYDIVRDRVYKLESGDESPYKSRDLTQVIVGDRIVCSGFSKILGAVLTELGIRNKVQLLRNNVEGNGHARNVCYIRDDKYGVEGIYYMDATFGSKKREGDDAYLKNYEYFARSQMDMELITRGIYRDISLGGFSRKMLEDIRESLNSDSLRGLSLDMVRAINGVAHFIDGKYLIARVMYDCMRVNEEYMEYIRERTERYGELMFGNTEIDGYMFLRILYNTRKAEFYDIGGKYLYDGNDLIRAVVRKEEKKLERSVMGFRIGMDENSFIKVWYDDEMAKEINRVKVCKVLRLGLDKKRELGK